MNPALIFPTLLVLLVVACSPATAQRRGFPPFRPPFRPPLPRRPNPNPPSGGRAPTRAEAEDFLRSNPTAQRQMASVKARAASQPHYAVPPCPCTQATCAETTNFKIFIFDGSNPCITIFPFGISSTDCTVDTDGDSCTEIFGCGTATGTCTNWNPTTQTVFAVCFSPIIGLYGTILDEPVNNGCCCST